jgi:hypothetical protein
MGQVWQIPQTGEIFADYEAYLNRYERIPRCCLLGSLPFYQDGVLQAGQL